MRIGAMSKESSATSPETHQLPVQSVPSTSHFNSPVSTPGEIKAEIEADVIVVRNLKELEISFGRTMVLVKRHLDKCDLSEALLFLDSVIGSDVFNECDNFGKLMRQLQRDHIDVFNISILQHLVSNFDNHELNEVVEAYDKKKISFLNQTTVIEFQRAVVSRVKPILANGMAVITIKIPKKMADGNRTLKDIEELAIEGFEECHKKFISLHAEPGSIIISWVFPKELSSKLEELVIKNAAVFKANEVLEVTVAGKRVFPNCTQEEVRKMSSCTHIFISTKLLLPVQYPVGLCEEKSKLKELYTKFYPQLVEAVSDPDTCHSLSIQLHSTCLLSEEKKAVLSSSVASGRSFLQVLEVEEEPCLVTVLMEKMSAVKQLQTLSVDMSDWLSGSKQGI